MPVEDSYIAAIARRQDMTLGALNNLVWDH